MHCTEDILNTPCSSQFRSCFITKCPTPAPPAPRACATCLKLPRHSLLQAHSLALPTGRDYCEWKRRCGSTQWSPTPSSVPQSTSKNQHIRRAGRRGGCSGGLRVLQAAVGFQAQRTGSRGPGKGAVEECQWAKAAEFLISLISHTPLVVPCS